MRSFIYCTDRQRLTQADRLTYRHTYKLELMD